MTQLGLFDQPPKPPRLPDPKPRQKPAKPMTPRCCHGIEHRSPWEATDCDLRGPHLAIVQAVIDRGELDHAQRLAHRWNLLEQNPRLCQGHRTVTP